MEKQRNIFSIYVYGNIHISLIAAFCFYLYNQRLDQAFIIFFATFFYYNLCNIIYIKDYSKTIHNQRLTWVSKHLTEIIFASIGASIMGVFISIKLYESQQFTFNFPALLASLFFSIIYFFIRHTPILKNVIIGIVWLLVMRIWTHWDLSYFDLFLFLYLACISILYDKTKNQLKKVLIDCLIILPFLFYAVSLRYFLF